jgi:hypothetical protein
MIGKEHSSYQCYVKLVPIAHRPMASMEQFPRTPPVELKCSKRGFDSLLRRWRRALHTWNSMCEAPKLGVPLVYGDSDCAEEEEEDEEEEEEKEEEEGGGEEDDVHYNRNADDNDLNYNGSISHSTDSGEDQYIIEFEQLNAFATLQQRVACPWNEALLNLDTQC